MHRPQRVAAGAFTAGIAAALVLTGCSNSNDEGGDTPATSDAGATTALNSAADATAALTGAHVVLTVDGKYQALNASKVDVDLETKPGIEGKGTTTLNMGDKTVDAPFVYIDGKLYANVDDKGYQDYGDGRSIYDVSKVLDAEKGVPNILRKLEGAKIEGEENVGGVAATKITGTIPAKELSSLAGTAPQGEQADKDVPATVWVTKDGKNQVARVVVEPGDNVKMTVDIDKWNQKVDVTKPAKVDAPSEKPKSQNPSEPTRDSAGS